MSMTMAARAYDDEPMSVRARPERAAGRQGARQRGRSGGGALFALAWFKRRLRRRPISTLAYCGFAAVAALVAVNALALQQSMIPRAFLGEPAQKSAAAPAPPARPAELNAAQRQAATPPATIPAAAPAPAARLQPARETPREAAARESASRDPLGDLIRTGQVGSVGPVEPVRPPASVPAQDSRPVLAAQRALNRTGHGPVKADGLFGEETRAAIERFERERRIPVTRDLSPRTLRELATASGMRME